MTRSPRATLRVVLREPDGTLRVGMRTIRRVEVVIAGETVAEIGATDISVAYPLDALATLTISTPFMEQVTE